jgi:hypothetical protein
MITSTFKLLGFFTLLFPVVHAALDGRVVDFLGQHCYDCHEAGTTKGGLRLDDLTADFTGVTSIDIWQKVLENLETEEMPPKKKEKPADKDRKQVMEWIRARFMEHDIAPVIDHKRRSPEFGNHLDHAALFDGSHQGPAYSPPRLWRLGPHAYDRFVDDVKGLRRATTIHQPFSIDESKGVIADYAAKHFADSATLQLLMMNCQSIAEYQTTGILKRERDGRMHRHQNSPDPFRVILENDEPPVQEQLKTAIAWEYQLVLEREPSEEEMNSSLAFCENAIRTTGKKRGLQATLVSIMLKPEAVYRMEIGLGEKDINGRRRLSSIELAFALSFALMDRGPGKVGVGGESLLKLARDGKLESPEQIQSVVKGILDENDMSTADFTMFARDHKIRNIRVLRFFRDFFGYHHAPRVFKDENRIGIDSGYEIQRIVNDCDQFVMKIFDEDKDVLGRLLTSHDYFVAYPGSFEKFEKDLGYIRKNKDDQNFKVNISYIKRTEAAGRTPIPIEGPSSRSYVGLYNIDHKTWDYPTEQPFPLPEKERAGILMHPAWLIAWSGNFDTDPIRRGKWIREHLLAGTVPEIPITVDAVIPEDRHQTLRERLTATTARSCWNCHEKMNPLGLPFENFDDFGRFRRHEILGEVLSIFPDRHQNATSVPVDTRGSITGSGEAAMEGEVANAFELVHKLADSDIARQSFIRHAFRYWLGRNEGFDDSPTLVLADRAYTGNGGSMKSLIASLLSSDSFLYRKSQP